MKQILLLVFFLSSLFSSAQPRERLEYHLRYGIIKGGEAVILVSDTTFEKQKAIHYSLRGKTVGISNVLYNIDDRYETLINPKTVYPFLHIRNIKEARYRYYNETRFYPENDSIFTTKSGGRKVPADMLDILTVFYFLRQDKLLEKLKVGDHFSLPVYHANKHFMMKTTFLGIEKVKTKWGDKECYVISPAVDEGKLLKTSDGLKFYITKDKDKVPLILELDLTVGAVRAELVSYEKY